MAKRARGTTSRPGQRAPLARSSSSRRPADAPRPAADASTDARAAARSASLTADEEARAAELEAQIVEQERAAERAANRSRREAREAADRPTRAGSITDRAAEEYAYVARDVRRIAIIGSALVAGLIGLWALTQATGVTPAL